MAQGTPRSGRVFDLPVWAVSTEGSPTGAVSGGVQQEQHQGESTHRGTYTEVCTGVQRGVWGSTVGAQRESDGSAVDKRRSGNCHAYNHEKW